MEPLTHRQRLARSLRHQPVDRLPDYEFGAWVQTYDRWAQEGMDVAACKGLGREVHRLDHYFHTDTAAYGPGLKVNVGMLPAFEEKVLEDRGQTEIIQDREGTIAEQLKEEFGASIPRYIRHAIQTRADWEQFCSQRLDPAHPERVPQNLDDLAPRFNAAETPLVVHLGSLYGWLRDWVGVEALSLMLYDDRPLVEEMMEHLTVLTLSVLEKLAGRGLIIDQTHWWEDMCYRSGSLLSPRMFREMMVPRYQRITRFLAAEFGCEYNLLDCDGNIHQLAAPWLESGINIMFPIESAHTDVYRLAPEFAERGFLRGAFDKRALIDGPAAIEGEFERLRPLIESRQLIPHTDHLVPPDVSFENYLYYRRRKCELLGIVWREPGIQPQLGALQDWLLLGPFENAANRGFHAALEPEPDPDFICTYPGKGGRQIAWQKTTRRTPSGYVDLAQELGHEPWSVAYALCDVYAPDARAGWLELGSDDGIQAWLNTRPIWKHDVYREAAPGQDLVKIRLAQGWNRLLLKIGQAEGEWGFHCRLTDEAGQPWPDLEVEATYE